MTYKLPSQDIVFNRFEKPLVNFAFPERFPYPFEYKPHKVSVLAAESLQLHLQNQNHWTHNFGLTEAEGAVIGKMFGVLVVRTENNEIGYISAFSGKLAGQNHHPGFVPPIFDGTGEGSFLNAGMTELSRIGLEITRLEKLENIKDTESIDALKLQRRSNSVALQNKIFDQYHFLNQAGEKKSLRDIFGQASYKNPPAGAGECAAPKLLQYAFGHKMEPLAMAEFWWGLSPKSASWKHGHYYPACREKCAPILGHMLSGMNVDEKPEGDSRISQNQSV